MLTFAECTRAHLPAVRDFWSRSYGPHHVLGVDAELFQWQFGQGAGGRLDSRTPDQYHMKLALDGDEVIGCLGFIPTEVMVCGETLRGCWLANWMVDPQRARLGIGPLLLREVLRGVDVIVNVGISPDARTLLARMGWLDLNMLSRWVRPLQQPVADALLGDNVEGEWPAAPAIAAETVQTVHEVTHFDPQAEALWDRVWGAQGAGTRRTAALLDWRYAKHPRFRYELLELRGPDALTGFAVYRVEQTRDRDARVGRIVELVADGDNASALIAGVCQHAASRDVAVLDFFCTSNRLHNALVAHGFQRGDSGRAQYMPQLFQPLDRRRAGIACMISASHAAIPRATDSWYVTKGDADQDRPN